MAGFREAKTVVEHADNVVVRSRLRARAPRAQPTPLSRRGSGFRASSEPRFSTRVVSRAGADPWARTFTPPPPPATPHTGAGSLTLDWRMSGLLGAVAGAIDAVGWVCLAGLLPSHLTASLVVLGASLSERDGADVRARLAMVPVFVASVALVKWLAHKLQARGLPVLPTLLVVLTLGLAVLLLCGTLSDALLADDPSVLLGLGSIAVGAMAVQNAIMRLCLTNFGPTTVMTGNLTQVVIATVDIVAGRRHHSRGPDGTDREPRKRLVQAGLPLCGFIFGTVSCGFAATRWGLSALILPLAFSTYSSVLAWRALPPLEPVQSRVSTPSFLARGAARFDGPRSASRRLLGPWPLAHRSLVRGPG